MLKLSRTRLFACRARAWIRDDSGVAALLVAAAIAVIAFTALSIFLNKLIGDRELARLQSSATGEARIKAALYAYYYKQSSTHTLPCPDTTATPDGTADTCGTSSPTRGVVPWRDLGLSETDVVDAYGDYFTYVVSGVAKDMCTSVGYDLNPTAAPEYTGSLISATDLSLVSSDGASRNIAFALIGHGANRASAKARGGTATAASSNTVEATNNGHSATSGIIHADAYSAGVFDDDVFAPSISDLEKVCKTLSPGSALNATIGENFDSPSTSLPSTFTASSTTPPTKVRTSSNNGVARFSANTSYMATAASIAPLVRPVYVAAKWIPNAEGSAVSAAGISIATRATSTDLTDGTDIFAKASARGITFRFYDAGITNNAGATGSAGVANHLYICDSATSACTSSINLGYSGTSTYNLISGKTYNIEAFDDGTSLWARITQDDAPTNTAYVRATTTATNDAGGSQSVIFVNDSHTSASVSYLDETVVGVPMLALETDGTDDVVSSAANTNALTGGGPYSLTLEAWIRPRALPSGTGAIISRWDASASPTASSQGYRLYLDSSGTLNLSVSGNVGSTPTIENKSLGFQPELLEWTHVAVTFDASAKTISSYKNGALVYSTATTIDGGVNGETSQGFSVGAEYNGAAIVDEFTGDISDVRVWKTARASSDIGACYEIRLPSTAPCTTTNMVVNWKLDPGIGGSLTSTTAAAAVGTAGILSGAVYAPALAVYFRPFSTVVCPSNKAGPYECDFRPTNTTTTATVVNVDIPSNLPAVYAKVWGAGGGGYSFGGNSRSGGSGGYSAGLLQTSTTGLNLSVLAGGGGTGSTTQGTGAGGGAGSVVQRFDSTTMFLIAGGGGGGSYSSDSSTSCNGSTATCGQGGDGGGTAAATSIASDGTSTCGGRGGDNSPSGNNPPTGGDCPDAGADPTGLTTTGGIGGAGASGAAGGGGVIGTHNVSGGRGYQPADTSGSANSSAVGAGGGGGGYIGGEAGGHDDSKATTGYGGGGGSGNANGATNTFVSSSSFSDSACTANFNAHDDTGTVTGCTGSSVIDLVARGWAALMSITASGPGIPADTTLKSVSTTTFVMSAEATTGASRGVTVTGSASSTGTSDTDYSPSTLPSGYASPGLGGTSGETGHAGAVLLFW